MVDVSLGFAPLSDGHFLPVALLCFSSPGSFWAFVTNFWTPCRYFSVLRAAVNPFWHLVSKSSVVNVISDRILKRQTQRQSIISAIIICFNRNTLYASFLILNKSVSQVPNLLVTATKVQQSVSPYPKIPAQQKTLRLIQSQGTLLTQCSTTESSPGLPGHIDCRTRSSEVLK
jgi:hypothetical protein